jgi:hypothetical protein
MNFLAHFLTGYFIARFLGYKHNQYQTFILCIAAILPDLDVLVSFLLLHGGWTHSILIASLMGISFWFLLLIFNSSIQKTLQISPLVLLGLIFLGLSGHLFLDIFTYLKSDCLNTIAHIYLWPFSNLSFHMNCLWSSVAYWHRIVIEISYFSILLFIALYRWKRNNENLFEIFMKKIWLQYEMKE